MEGMIESLDELRTLVRVVDEGSLTAAARALHLSVNAVSRRIAALEERLGVRLANRTTRRIAFTDEGRRFVERCRRILAEADEAESELRPPGDVMRGSVRIAVPAEILREPLMAAFGKLLRDHKDLSLQVLARNEPLDPVAAGLDLVLWPGDVRGRTLIARKVGTISWVLAASTAYVRARGQPRRPRDLAAHDCLKATRSPPETHWVLRDDRGREISAKVGGRFESDDGPTLAAALYAGLGIGIRPAHEVDQAAKAGRVVRVLAGWRFAPLTIYLVAPPGRMRLPRVRAVADLVQTAVQDVT